MKLVNDTPNWIEVTDEDEVPPTAEWKVDNLYNALHQAVFALHHCGKYTLVYRSEVILRREGPTVKGQENLIVDVECRRDSENLRYAGQMSFLDSLPVEDFTVYRLEEVASGS